MQNTMSNMEARFHMDVEAVRQHAAQQEVEHKKTLQDKIKVEEENMSLRGDIAGVCGGRGRVCAWRAALVTSELHKLEREEEGAGKLHDRFKRAPSQLLHHNYYITIVTLQYITIVTPLCSSMYVAPPH